MTERPSCGMHWLLPPLWVMAIALAAIAGAMLRGVLNG